MMKSTLAKSDNGTVQVTFTIAWEEVDKARKKVLKSLSGEVEIPGFRKGKAPLSKVEEHISKDKLLEKTLSEFFPQILKEIINVHKIRPALYPRLELISVKDKEDWQIRAVTCDYPIVDLGDYKKAIMGASRAKSLWTPNKGRPKGEKNKELSKAEKEQEVLKILLETVKVKIPPLMIEEEVNSRLSQLLARLEKLGLNLESYLASIGKTTDVLRGDYAKQADNTIKLEIILNEISEKENISISEDEISEAIKISLDSSSSDKSKTQINSPQNRALIRSVLRKRAVLDKLTASI